MIKVYKQAKGFTLIELLVVIAIIGILAGVVLASLGTARDSARDASAQASISAARAEAEIYANQNAGSYSGVCATSSPGLSSIVTSVDAEVPGSAVCTDPGDGTFTTPNVWVLGAALNDGTWYCADSTGFSGTATTITESSTSC